jgi:hypothetical protein
MVKSEFNCGVLKQWAKNIFGGTHPRCSGEVVGFTK